MIKLNSDSKIYVICPVGLQTGGTELCHQLVDYLNSNGRESYMVYISSNYEIVEALVPISFQNYNINTAIKIENTTYNVLVFPETLMQLIRKLDCDQMYYVFWWLSIDNYFHVSGLADYLSFEGDKTLRGILSKIKTKVTKRFIPVTFRDLRSLSSRSLNVYQSAYANHYLLKKGLFNQLPLSDYLNLELVSDSLDLDNRKDIILYNPSKGFEVTEKIIKKLPNLSFVPLKNFNRTELQDLMSRAKLYIDFGNHPGKDRIPREAVINGCCILVGRKGSAKFFQDVPISNEYKFLNEDIDGICNKIEYILKNYKLCYDDFDFIRKVIKEEKVKFEEEIRKIFFE